jgi:hypothetical protein
MGHVWTTPALQRKRTFNRPVECLEGADKSFWGIERKFSDPLMRFARSDVRDHIV